jgi:hypothetical protein
MSRGGFRVGSGRPPGSKNNPKGLGPPTNMTGVEYLQRLVNDPKADWARRDRSAAVLASYEARLSHAETKKETLERLAATSHLGTKWERLLRRDPPPAPEYDWERLDEPLPQDGIAKLTDAQA